MADFSIIILTFNEEVHLHRLFNAIKGLNAPVFVLDSGSSDRTIELCRQYGASTAVQPFINHPTQWDTALQLFPITTPWVIGIDADQYPDPALFAFLLSFRDQDHDNIDGIFFCRKFTFKGKWIRHGGYFPFYQLKMFRYGIGYSDLNENMDHRFVVSGGTKLLRDAYLIEENFKENAIAFWIEKHNRYSDLVAREEMERREVSRKQPLRLNFLGNPDERRAVYKNIWWKLPLYLRPFIYFAYRMIIQLGFLDGRTGIVFHFLQAFWFRLIVDIKITELRRARKNSMRIP